MRSKPPSREAFCVPQTCQHSASKTRAAAGGPWLDDVRQHADQFDPMAMRHLRIRRHLDLADQTAQDRRRLQLRRRLLLRFRQPRNLRLVTIRQGRMETQG